MHDILELYSIMVCILYQWNLRVNLDNDSSHKYQSKTINVCHGGMSTEDLYLDICVLKDIHIKMSLFKDL